MAAITGFGGSVKIGSNTVANVKSWEIPLAADMYDISVLGSQWKAYLPGLTGATAKVDVFWDTTDTTGQMAIQNALLNGTSLSLTLLLGNTHSYAATTFVKQIDIKNPVNAPVEASLDIQLSGAVTYS